MTYLALQFSGGFYVDQTILNFLKIKVIDWTGIIKSPTATPMKPDIVISPHALH